MSSDLRARVSVNGKEIYLGKFKTPEEARQAEHAYRLAHGLSLTYRDRGLKGARTKKRLGIRNGPRPRVLP